MIRLPRHQVIAHLLQTQTPHPHPLSQKGRLRKGRKKEKQQRGERQRRLKKAKIKKCEKSGHIHVIHTSGYI